MKPQNLTHQELDDLWEDQTGVLLDLMIHIQENEFHNSSTADLGGFLSWLAVYRPDKIVVQAQWREPDGSMRP